MSDGNSRSVYFASEMLRVHKKAIGFERCWGEWFLVAKTAICRGKQAAWV